MWFDCRGNRKNEAEHAEDLVLNEDTRMFRERYFKRAQALCMQKKGAKKEPKLQMELPARSVHLASLVDPLVLPELRVERALLQPPQLKREPGPQLLQLGRRLVLVFLVNVPAPHGIWMSRERVVENTVAFFFFYLWCRTKM
jgi:hypothetical protein